jgi:hypothetical protein
MPLRKLIQKPAKAVFPPVGKKKPVLVLAPEGRHLSGWMRRGRKEELRGLQALPTETVKKFAERFPGNDLETVKKILKAVSRFKKVPLGLDEIKHYYAKRTAEDVIHSRKIVTLKKEDRRKTGMNIYGCNDYALALIGTLRAKGITALFFREGEHTGVIFKLGDRYYYADPSAEPKAQPFYNSIKNLPHFFASFKGKKFDSGRDAWAIGMFSLDDYWKFASRREGDR